MEYNTLTTRLQGLSVDIGLQGDIRTSSIRNFVPRFAPFKSIDTLWTYKTVYVFSFSSIIIIIYYCDCLHQQRMQFQFLGSLILLRFPWVNARFVIVLYCNYCIVSVCYCISWYCISSLIVYTTDLRVHKH